MKNIKAVWQVITGIFRLKEQALWVKIIFLLYVFVALFAPFLANNEPLLMAQNGHLTFPAFQRSPYIILHQDGYERPIRRTAVDWKVISADFLIFAPIPYDPVASDLSNYNFISPFEKQWSQRNSENAERTPLPLRYRHWLGTTKTGADVLSGLIHSTRLSLSIGFLTMLIATFLGITLGALAGFYGDNGIRVSIKNLILSAALIVPSWYYIFIFPERSVGITPDINIPSYFIFLKIILFLFILLLPFTLKKRKRSGRKAEKSVSLPLDTLISRFIELFLSVPRLILIITLAAISRPSVFALIMILGFTSWTGIARMVRAEFIRLRHSGFAEATSSMGFSPMRKIFYHLLPNAFVLLRVGIIFGIAGAILAEAGLSFLGIGLAPNTISWGSLLAAGREQFSAWWLVIFPGIAISVLLLILNKLATEKRYLPLE